MTFFCLVLSGVHFGSGRFCVPQLQMRQCMIALQVGQQLHLSSLAKRAPAELASGDGIMGPVIIDKSAMVGSGCLIGPDVSIGPDCVIGDGVRLSNCVIMKGCTVRHTVLHPLL
jgi:UDP-3-O-[3-hydroxymyristoyl] glucosamine N-acyltransferase